MPKITIDKKTILSGLLILAVVLAGIFLWHRLTHPVLAERPSAELASTWFLPANDGIGEAALNLYQDNTFDLRLAQNKREWRTGTYRFTQSDILELRFTDKKEKYDVKNNKYFTESKVLDPYTIQLKVLDGKQPYLNFFNYFFYQK